MGSEGSLGYLVPPLGVGVTAREEGVLTQSRDALLAAQIRSSGKDLEYNQQPWESERSEREPRIGS
jgi:hypothetical protein